MDWYCGFVIFVTHALYINVEKTEKTIKNGQSRTKGNNVHTRHETKTHTPSSNVRHGEAVIASYKTLVVLGT